MTLIQELRQQLERVVRDKHWGLYSNDFHWASMNLDRRYSCDYEDIVQKVRRRIERDGRPMEQYERIAILEAAIQEVVVSG